jgi:hypothetical protein
MQRLERQELTSVLAFRNQQYFKQAPFNSLAPASLFTSEIPKLPPSSFHGQDLVISRE